jgi:hypothetical protein
MVLTKQLQVLIQSSLAQGRDFEDIRSILMKQGFQDADISELFSQYRGAADTVQQPKAPPITDTDLGLIKTQTSTPPITAPVKAKEQIFNQNFVHPEVKPGFVPVGFEAPDTAQEDVKNEIDTFMNVGTNTQTAAHTMNQQQNLAQQTMTQEQRDKLPAPGTVALPSELKNEAPKVLNESGVAEGEVAQPVAPIPVQTRDASQKYINVGFAGMPEMEKVLYEEEVKKKEKSPWPLVFALLILISLMGAFYYWFFILNKDTGEMSESEKLLQEIENEKAAEQMPVTPPAPTGPIDPFTGLPLESS